MAVLLVGTVLLVACTTSAPGPGDRAGSPATTTPTPTPTAATTPATVRTAGPPRAGLAGKPARDHDPVLAATIDRVQSYWSTQLPDLEGAPFHPLTMDRLYPYDADTEAPPCGGQQRSYDQLRGNAFYCRSDRFVAWDDGDFLPRLEHDVGSGAVALVLAHEWGHVVQDELGVEGAPLLLELQADCLAGMWMHDSMDATADDPLGPLATHGDQALSGLLLLRDDEAVRPTDPSAHGRGFDRIAAFERGFEQSTCFTFDQQRPTVLAIDFPTTAPARQRSYDEALADATAALNDWHRAQDPSFVPVTDLRPYDRSAPEAMTCGSDTYPPQLVAPQSFLVCPSAPYLAYDRTLARTMYDTYGDGALLAMLAVQWDSVAAGEQARSPGFDLFAGAAFRECRTGVLLRDLVAGRVAAWPMAPTELDEAIAAMLYTRPLNGGGPAGGVTEGFFAVRDLQRGFTGSAPCAYTDGAATTGPGSTSGAPTTPPTTAPSTPPTTAPTTAPR